MTAQYNYLIDTGEIVADTADVLSDVQAEFRAATRQSLNLSAATPQGSLCAAEVLARTNVMKTAAERANVINPQLSFGNYLDAVCSFNGIPRTVSRSTIGKSLLAHGNDGITIPAGYTVKTPAGDVFSIISTAVIGPSLSVLVDVKSVAYGPIDLPVGPMTIVDGVIGWGSIEVLSTSTVTLGAVSLTDPQLKNSRNARLGLQGTGNSAAIVARVLGVPNVTSVSVVENNTGATGIVEGVTFSLPNAFWVCVAGNADPQAVANALYDAHGGGCPWDYGASGNGVPVGAPNGVAVQDPVTGKNYRVKSTTPIMYDAYIKVIVKQGTSSASPVESIQTALMNYSKGLMEGEAGYVVGASVSAFEAGGAISASLPGLYVRSVSVACVPKGAAAPAPGDYSTEFTLTPFQQAELFVGNINVVVQ